MNRELLSLKEFKMNRRCFFSFHNINNYIIFVSREEEERINNFTYYAENSWDISQKMIISTLKRSNSSEHHRLFEEFIIFFYRNHRRIIHIRSLVNKSFFFVQNFFFDIIISFSCSNHNSLFSVREFFTKFSWFT